MDATTLFVHRKPGDKAIHIGGAIAGTEAAVRVVLEAADGRVLVRSVRRQPDGTFIGEVYGVMPGQRSVAIGDFVQFQESQIFRFRTAEETSTEAVEPHMADMVRKFEEVFGELPVQADKQPIAPDFGAPADVLDTPAARNEDRPAPSPAIQAPADVAPAAARTKADEARQDRGIDEALGVIRPSEKHTSTAPPERVEPVLVDQPPPAPVPGAREISVKCIECGTRIVVLPRQDTTPLRASCPRCGRINNVAEAKPLPRPG